MIQRCKNPNHVGFASYGGRGIKVCDRWAESFENFLEDMGERPEGASLERVDVNGDYCQENCCWMPRKEQQNNTTRSKPIEYNGEVHNVHVWARKLGLDQKLINKRLKSGWSVEDALSISAGFDKQALQTRAKDLIIAELFKSGRYEVTECGRIISNEFGHHKGKTAELKQQLARNGYKRVGISFEGKYLNCAVHRIVALVHLYVSDEFMVVNHKDGDKTNNNYSNLEWLSSSDNVIHAIKNGLRGGA